MATKTNFTVRSILEAMHQTGRVQHDERMHSEHFFRPADGWDFHLDDGRMLRVMAKPEEWESGVDVFVFADDRGWEVEREMRQVVGLTPKGWKLVLEGMIA